MTVNEIIHPAVPQKEMSRETRDRLNEIYQDEVQELSESTSVGQTFFDVLRGSDGRIQRYSQGHRVKKNFRTSLKNNSLTIEMVLTWNDC